MGNAGEQLARRPGKGGRLELPAVDSLRGGIGGIGSGGVIGGHGVQAQLVQALSTSGLMKQGGQYGGHLMKHPLNPMMQHREASHSNIMSSMASSSAFDSTGLALLAPGSYRCRRGGGGDGTAHGGAYIPQVGDQVCYYQQAQLEEEDEPNPKQLRPAWFGRQGTPHAVDCTVVAAQHRFRADHLQQLHDRMDRVLAAVEAAPDFFWFAEVGGDGLSFFLSFFLSLAP